MPLVVGSHIKLSAYLNNYCKLWVAGWGGGAKGFFALPPTYFDRCHLLRMEEFT